MVAFNRSANFADIPPPSVLDWCRELVRVIEHGGVWGIPRSDTIFRIDQDNKRLVCVALGPDGDDSDFYATKHVFAHIGWDVVMAAETESKNDN